MSFGPNDLPNSPAEWEKAQRGLKAENIHTVRQLDSASEIKRPQFLLLRALWVRKLQERFKIKDWLEEAYIAEAVSFLDQYPDWKSYLNSFSQFIELEQRPFPNLGAFTVVKYSQLEVSTTKAGNSSPNAVVSPVKTRSMTAAEKAQNATPSKAPTNLRKFPNAEDDNDDYDDDDDDYDEEEEDQNVTDESVLSPLSPAKKGEQKVLYPPTEDEQIVNAALLNFLTVVTIAHPDVCLRWCLARRVLKFVCNAGNRRAVGYQARTDGYLRGLNLRPAYAIVEVKPYIREEKPHTRWQETAQMAAWIWEDSSLQSAKFQRFLVSQDRHEIYLTFAIFDSSYVRYLKEGTKEGEPFLRMHEFEPLDIRKVGHMKKVGEVILAMTLQMSNLHRGRPAISSDPQSLVDPLSRLTMQSNQTGRGLFGGASQSTQTGGLFGTSTSQPTQSGGLFGGSQSGRGLFGGANTQSTQSGGLFGGGASQPAQSGGLFGGESSQPAQTGGLFGNATSETPRTPAPKQPQHSSRLSQSVRRKYRNVADGATSVYQKLFFD